MEFACPLYAVCLCAAVGVHAPHCFCQLPCRSDREEPGSFAMTGRAWMQVQRSLPGAILQGQSEDISMGVQLPWGTTGPCSPIPPAVVTVQGLWHWAVARAAAASSCCSLAPLHQLLAVSEFVLAASTETRQYQQISTSCRADWLSLAFGCVILMTSAQAPPQLVTVHVFWVSSLRQGSSG